MKKIKIKSLEKPKDYIEKEWATLLSKKIYLLSVSDWTQLDNNNLTFESKVKWNAWRDKLRNISRDTMFDVKMAENVLSILEKQIPESNFIKYGNESNILRLNDFNKCKLDALRLLKKYHMDWILYRLPENIEIIREKIKEKKNYLLSNNISEFPLINNMMQLYSWDLETTLKEIDNLENILKNTMIDIDNHLLKYTTKLNLAKSSDEILNIVTDFMK
jgi:hypothetical protein